MVTGANKPAYLSECGALPRFGSRVIKTVEVISNKFISELLGQMALEKIK